MPLELEPIRNLFPVEPEVFKPYLKKGMNPPLDINRMGMTFLMGDERHFRLRTPVTGDCSLVLSYERNNNPKEGVVISLQEEKRDLRILQIQGVNSRIGYRLITGLDLESLVADQVRRIGCYLFRMQIIDRLAFPVWAKGIENASSEFVSERYATVASLLGLKLSHEENLIVG